MWNALSTTLRPCAQEQHAGNDDENSGGDSGYQGNEHDRVPKLPSMRNGPDSGISGYLTLVMSVFCDERLRPLREKCSVLFPVRGPRDMPNSRKKKRRRKNTAKESAML